jgi:hypothetical protein
MKKHQKIILYTLLFSLSFLAIYCTIPNVHAYSSYAFYVRKMESNVFIQLDGSVIINYEIDFENKGWASTINVIDMGFPNKYYELDSVNASIGGHKITDIRKSTVMEVGVEVWLGSFDIHAGASAHFSLNGTNNRMTYQDYDNRSMASVEFSPTWFSSDYCYLYDVLEVNIWFPETVSVSAEGITKWHYAENGVPTIGWENELMYFRWTKTNAAMKQYKFGVSFPGDALNENAIQWTANPMVVEALVNILFSISLCALIIGIIYLTVRYFTVVKKRYYPPKTRTTASSDFCCCGLMVAFFIMTMFVSTWYDYADIYIVIGFYSVLLAGFGMLGYLLYRVIRRIGRPYSKPELLMESAGIRKDLSVVEAAIIQNTPLSKVVFLVMYGLMNSGHLAIIDVEPLKLEITSQEGWKELKWYHKQFLEAIKTTDPNIGSVDELKLKTLLVDLIKRVDTTMKGYDGNLTKAYYKNMINSAWEKVQKLPQNIKWDSIKNEYEWLMVDDLFEERSKRYFSDHYYDTDPYWIGRYHYYPYYYNQGYYSSYYPHSHYNVSPPVGRVSPAIPSNINIHSVSDSIVRSIENISNKLVTNFTNFADGIVNSVRPIVKPAGGSGSGGRSYSGGGGCACACACAGCACACAGGGR